jgi:PKD repeat protein
MISLSLLRVNVRFQTSEAGDVKITDFYSCDALGVPQDHFPKKTTAYFNISVRNPAQDPKNISISITVQDELSVPVGSDQLDATVPQNASAYYIMNVFLPKWAYVGLAMAYASLWEEGTPIEGKTTQFYIDPEDLTPPVISILSPGNATYDTEPLSLVFAVNERTTWIGHSLNGLGNVTVGGNTTLSGLDNGSHRIRVYANDTSGNTGSSEEIHFTMLIVHDVAVIDLECSSAEVCVGQVVNINVTVLNEGTMTEAFSVTTYANSTAIETLTVTSLPRNNQEFLVFKWGTISAAPGNYTIKAVAGTVAGETDTADNTYIDGDVKIIKPPVANFTFSPNIPFTGETITFNASLSTKDGGIIISYEWSFGDGTPDAIGMIATHAYADNGTCTATLIVTDSDGLTDTDSQNITVLNRPPIASFTESATTVFTGTIISFDASSSYDPDGYIADYFWDFGDGTNATGILVNHAYAGNGTYTVTLTVTDDDGTSTSTKAIKTVLNRPDIAVTNVTTSKTVVGQGYNVSISVTVENQGDYTETFNVTCYANTTIITTFVNITLTSGNAVTFTFVWETAGFAKGDYAIMVSAIPVQGEADTTDNDLTDGWIYVGIPGDINADHRVDVFDAVLLTAASGTNPTSPNWNPNADINNDFSVDLFDAVILAGHAGEHYP